eukprot:TRINITY_DN2317_c0_g1_i6.p1 TRINITY_DN2317_c0_g1~~TRINITY_DN2317_c0_g1_i6.p1  ORF type:complete len:586 (+),score=117.18 TRINITY_DN2317_c0_g1_i6:74-1831(+)
MAPMKSVQGHVKALFTQALKGAFPSIQQETLVVKGNPKFGDFQCNNAMGLFKEHGKALGYDKPMLVAEAIKANLPKNDMVADITVAPQGFVTVKLAETWLSARISGLLNSELQYRDTLVKRVVVDFSSPNIAKEMHVGHLRSTIIGESTCRILEFCGHEVHRLNHVGDWGTQFGMLIEYMKEVYPNFQDSTPEVRDLQEFYKASKKRFDDDEEFKKRAQLNVVDLQSGGEYARMAWQKICDVSRQAFQKVYDRLDITVEERGESFYNALIKPLVVDLQARGLVVESDGAQCLFTPRVSPQPLMAVKSDGGYGYDSTDLACIYHRLFMMRADWIIYVTDLGQEQHFHMIFDAAEQAGWHRPPITRCDHMGFGVVQGDDGKKFKTRSGETVKLVDLLNEAVDRATVEITKRVAEQKEKEGEVFLKDPQDQTDAANKIAIAAIRYFDMKQNRTSNYIFSYDKMLDPRGNTAVYLFYAYARIRAIQRKGGIDIATISSNELRIEHPAERDLAFKLLCFADVIESILSTLHVHFLTEYLWELCNVLTTFYLKCKVIGEKEMRSRLLLCEATRKVLHKSFFLLGFTPLEKL